MLGQGGGSVCVFGVSLWGGLVSLLGGGVHDDDTYMTPQGRPDFIALGLKTQRRKYCVVSLLYKSNVRWPMQQAQGNKSTQEALV